MLGKLTVWHIIELLTLKRSFSSLFLQIYISKLCGKNWILLFKCDCFLITISVSAKGHG